MPKNSLKFNKAIISGWNLKKMNFWKRVRPMIVVTPYGKVYCYKLEDCIFIPRHGIKESIPPHKINHRANISAIKKIGIKYVFAFNSVGSLRKEIEPGEFLIASDYIDFTPPTFYEKEAKFIIPELSSRLGVVLKNILKKLKIKTKSEGGVYFQTRGPRFETKAEINFLKEFADVVGMTMASEATLANELNLEYISLFSVDNYANGIASRKLTFEGCRSSQKKMALKIEKIIGEIITTKIK